MDSAVATVREPVFEAGGTSSSKMDNDENFVVLHHEDAELERGVFAQHVANGLSCPEKKLSSLYFYDDKGSALFSKIIESEEYYLKRCELELLTRHAAEIIRTVNQQGKSGQDEGIDIVELGAGDGRKLGPLLQAMLNDKIDFDYYAIDISAYALHDLQGHVDKAFGHQVKARAIVADNVDGLKWLLSKKQSSGRKTLVLFLGSSIGNFDRKEAVEFLSQLQGVMRSGDWLLIGFDLLKDPALMRCAYDDSQGITREFNRNLLRRINRELGADLPADDFYHVANYNARLRAMESHLVAEHAIQTNLPAANNASLTFEAHEPIHMEYSHKYNEKSIAKLAESSQFTVRRAFYDSRHWFTDSLWQA